MVPILLLLTFMSRVAITGHRHQSVETPLETGLQGNFRSAVAFFGRSILKSAL